MSRRILIYGVDPKNGAPVLVMGDTEQGRPPELLRRGLAGLGGFWDTIGGTLGGGGYNTGYTFTGNCDPNFASCEPQPSDCDPSIASCGPPADQGGGTGTGGSGGSSGSGFDWGKLGAGILQFLSFLKGPLGQQITGGSSCILDRTCGRYYTVRTGNGGTQIVEDAGAGTCVIKNVVDAASIPGWQHPCAASPNPAPLLFGGGQVTATGSLSGSSISGGTIGFILVGAAALVLFAAVRK